MTPRDPTSSRGLAALVLMALAWTLLLAALAGAWWGWPRLGGATPSTLVLLDRSDSVPREAAGRALAQAQGADAQRWSVLPFALGVQDDASAQGTDIEAALRAALDRHARTPLQQLVVVSDGHQTQGNAEAALRELRRAGLQPQWVPVGRPPPPAAIASVLAPAQAQAGQAVNVQVQTAAPAPAGLRVRLRARGPDGAVLEDLANLPAQTNAASLAWRPEIPGPWRLDLAIEDTATGRVLQQSIDAALVDVRPRAALLYVAGRAAGPGAVPALADGLQQGGWPLQIVAASQLDSLVDTLPSWRAVVLDEVAVADASPRWWQALDRAVRTRGLGLLVLGGERAFARGAYRGSTLEGLLPLQSEPAALEAPLSVLFAVDKSGSMGEGHAGVDRFALAQRAVLEAARSLAPRDRLGLLVYDAQPRLLLPLQPAAQGVSALARDWDAAPRGGTQLGPALQAALDELARAPASSRLLVLVTDGFVADVPPAAVQSALARLQVQTVALAVGPDADVAALRRLFVPPSGQVLPVAQAAELPQRMRLGLERLRARIEQGRLAVEPVGPLPFEPSALDDWPDLDAYTVTRAQPGAVVALQSERGDPLIAHHRAGRGHVVAVASALGPWSSQWLAWRHWPVLAGGLAGAVASGQAAEPARVQVRDEADALVVDVQALGDVGPAPVSAWRLRLQAPSGVEQVLALVPQGPGRWRARLADRPPGLLTLHLDTPAGTVTRHHLRAAVDEDQLWGTSPELARWQKEGLIVLAGASPTAATRPATATQTAPLRDLQPAWLIVSLVLFLTGVLLDRWAGWAPEVRRVMVAGRHWLAARRRPESGNAGAPRAAAG